MPRNWVFQDKHRPPSGVSWEDIVTGTGKGKKWAKYHPDFLPFVEPVEMSAGTNLWQTFDGILIRTTSELLVEKASVDLYVLEIDCELVVGASLGEETTLVLVNRAKGGAVHGYPLTEGELEFKRRKYRDAAG
ncbi:MAG: hypothetical protein ACREHD_31855 [Pirellulales bacterium]